MLRIRSEKVSQFIVVPLFYGTFTGLCVSFLVGLISTAFGKAGVGLSFLKKSQRARGTLNVQDGLFEESLAS